MSEARSIRTRLPVMLAGALSMTSLMAAGYVVGWHHGTTGYERAAPEFMYAIVALTLVAVPLLLFWSEGVPEVLDVR